MDINTEIENLAENKIYEGLFNIFELELEEISRYVALTKGNMDVYSNKIHELHLRVCSEVENILKMVIHKYFVPTENVKTLWDTEKSGFLVENDLNENYEELRKEISAKKKRDLDKYLFGFPDFAFYFRLACEKINLNQKVIRFSGMVSYDINWEVIQPFEIEKGQNVPTWWTNYNKLKHDKIKHFHLCKLGDLISALSGLYILMLYLLKYNDNVPIQNRNYRLEKMTKAVVTMKCSFCSIKSKFFEASSASQAYPISSILTELIPEDEYREITIIQLEERTGLRWRNLAEIENNKLAEMDLKSLEYSILPGMNIEESRTSKLRSVEHSLFYVYLDFEKVINNKNQYFMELRLYGRFIN